MSYRAPVASLSPSPAGTFALPGSRLERGGSLIVGSNGLITGITAPNITGEDRRTPIDANTLIRVKMNMTTRGVGVALNDGVEVGNWSTVNIASDFDVGCPGLFDKSVYTGTAAGYRVESAAGVGEPTTAMTLSFWIRVNTTLARAGYWLLKQDSDGSSISSCNVYYDNTGAVIFKTYNTNPVSVSLGSYWLPVNDWTLITATADLGGDRIPRLYLNGVLLGSAAALAATSFTWSSRGRWTVGSPANGVTSFDGFVEDVRIENVARSASYIQDMYQRGMGLK